MQHILVLITIVQDIPPRSMNRNGQLLMTIADPCKVVDKHILTIFATNVLHFQIFATNVSYYFISPMKKSSKIFSFQILDSKTNPFL